MGFSVALYSSNNLPEVRGLFERVFGPWPGDDWWTWKYDSAPAHGSVRLLVRSEAGAVVAHVGLLVFNGCAPSGPGLVGQVMDVMVDPLARGVRSDGRSLFGLLLESLGVESSQRFPGLFAYGFAGLRPYRLGDKLGFYRHIHACYPRQGPLVIGPTRLLGPHRTLGYLRWRFVDHPIAHYAVVCEHTDVYAVVRTLSNGERWRVASFRGEFPATLLELPQSKASDQDWSWSTAPWVDRGYGPVTPEPSMIAGEVRLNRSCPSALVQPGLGFDPAQTDVF